MLTYEVRSARLFVETSVDKTSGFSGQYPKKPETRSSGSGRVGLGFIGFGFFRVGDPRRVKNSGRVGFQKFGFFAHPNK